MSQKDYEEYERKMKLQEEEIEYIMQREKEGKKFFSRIVGVIIIIVILVNWPAKKVYMKVDSIEDALGPIQTEASGGTNMSVKGIKVKIEFLASYQITARVVDAQKYYDFDTCNRLGPVDVGLAWGFMAKECDKVKFVSAGNRFLSYHTSDTSWYNSHGREAGIQPYWSNNHLIPADKHIEKLIRRIHKDDYVQITGYLVNATWKER